MRKQILFALVLIFIISSVHASVIGVSPSVVRFHKMIKGGYAEAEVSISTSFQEDIGAKIEPAGEIAEWITHDPKDADFVFSEEKPYTFSMIIEPPLDTPSGNYTGQLKFTTQELASVNSGAGSSVIAQVIMLIYVEVIGEEVVACRAGAFSVENSEIGEPFLVGGTVYNDGNVRLRPEFIIQVYDQMQTKIIYTSSFLGSMILPTKNRYIMQEVSHSLPVGQYFAQITLPQCDVTDKTTFDVVEKGQISDSGRMIGIRTNPKVNANELMPIFPVFENSGQRKVTAFFKGELRDLKTDRVVSVLESEKIEVNPKETVEFKMYYTPKKSGDYLVSGRVHYNNKITFDEQSKVIKVEGNAFSFSWLIYILAYIIIGLVILILIGKIKKAKKKNRF